MTKSEQESKLLQKIARLTLSRDDALWLSENIRTITDWPSLAQRAFHEGLATFLYSHCQSLNLLNAIPEETNKFLARIYAETSLINRHLLKEMEELENRLRKTGLQVIIFKGIALLKTVYSDVGIRPMEDIDLIVRQEHLQQLKHVLKGMGFVQNRLYPETFGKGILSIDIHLDFLSSHRIRSRQEIMDIRSANLWGSAIPVNGSVSLYRLSQKNNLIALSFHLLKHQYDRLIWFVDIAETLKAYKYMSDWHDLIEYSQDIFADRLLLYTLLLTKQFIDADVPEKILTKLGKDNLSAIEKYLIRLKSVHAPIGTLTNLLWMFQIRGTGKKIRFIKENMFPRREVMNQIFPDSSHHTSDFFRRSILVSSRFFLDILMSIRFALKGNLPIL